MIQQKDLGPWIIFIIFCVLICVGNFASEYLLKKENELNTSTPTYALSIENHSFCTTSYGSKAICGTILNNTNHSYRNVSVDINLYDESGALIGNTYDSIRNLDSGKKWKFEALYTNNAIGYNIKVSGY